ncbi:MAG: hypothetical protein Q7R88_02230 [bacterium]|nr:hypothetical protein [bacterium]
MDNIFLNKKLVAIHIKRFTGRAVPASAPNGALQVITMKRLKGDVAKAHRHVPKKRVTKLLQECLIVIKGKIRYDLFDGKGRRFKKVLVKAGEAMLILNVPHEVHFLENSLVYELKNGPFIDDKQFLQG